MIYCDTSFLLALYVEADSFHIPAYKIAARFKEPIPYTLLTELELLNGIRRSCAAKIIDQIELNSIFRQILTDESQGILVRQPINQGEQFAKARELSKRFTPEISARSLDILHVAAALILKAVDFGSFDEKQKVLARKAGLNPVPATGIPQR